MATKKRHFKFATNGGMVKVLEPSEDGGVMAMFDVSNLPGHITHQLLLYGLKQKLSDTVRDIDSTEGKVEGMRAMYERLEAGHFTMEREVGSRTVAAWIEAVAELKGISVAAAQKALTAYTEEQKKKIRESDKVKAKTAEIEAARKDGEEVDLTDL
jgi:hypothetical protein